MTVIFSKFHLKKHNDQLFFPQKKNSVRHPKMVVCRFRGQTCDPFRGSKIIFFSIFHLLVQFFGVKFTGTYHVKNTEPQTPFGNLQFFFCQNLTYSYSFLGRNLPGITMSLESLHNFSGITVNSRKNHEKFGFFDFCL